jgi:hypothetical protein
MDNKVRFGCEIPLNLNMTKTFFESGKSMDDSEKRHSTLAWPHLHFANSYAPHFGNIFFTNGRKILHGGNSHPIFVR